MIAAVTAPTLPPIWKKDKNGGVQPHQRKRPFSSVPPFVPQVCEHICRDFARGVSELAISKMYRVRREVVEQVIRAKFAQLLRPAVASAALLIGVQTFDAWEVATGQQEAIMRSFARNGRARKRGLEDSLAQVELVRIVGVAA